LDMLIASKHLGYQVQQLPIETVYLDDNRSSHFDPLFDSMRISFVLLRFSMVAVLTAVIDNAVFLTLFLSTGHVLGAQVAGRLAGIGFNYTAARRAVFLTRASHRRTLPRFLLLVALNATLSYAFIRFASTYLGWSVPIAKLVAEGALFAASFALQRDFVFVSRNP
jgi:putative flippase GtrA